MDRIAKVGFFHFGSGHGTPMNTLRNALGRKAPEDLKGALIVLPEGFNIGKCYHDSKAEENPEPDVTEALKSEALKHEITFVAALILASQQKRRSSAYLIDADDASLLCHKMVLDGMGDYEPCRDCCDEDNPRAYGGSLVGCLICADSDPPRPRSWAELNSGLNNVERDRLSAVISKMPSGTTSPTILCIPAHPHELYGGRAPGVWRNYTVIFASSCDRRGHGSSIGHLGETLAEDDGSVNVITIVNVPAPSAPQDNKMPPT